jgi:hypothetical protein
LHQVRLREIRRASFDCSDVLDPSGERERVRTFEASELEHRAAAGKHVEEARDAAVVDELGVAAVVAVADPIPGDPGSVPPELPLDRIGRGPETSRDDAGKAARSRQSSARTQPRAAEPPPLKW